MPRLALILLLGLRGITPAPGLTGARFLAEAARSGEQLEVILGRDGRPLGNATLLLQDQALHLALRGGLGAPVAVVRIAHGMVGLQHQVGVERVALDTAAAVGLVLGERVSPSMLVGLLQGQVPREATWTNVPGGYRASLDGLTLFVSPLGILERAEGAGWTADLSPGGWRVQGGGHRWTVDVVSRMSRPIPATAFDIAEGEVIGHY